MVGMLLVLALTVYQVLAPSSMLGLGLDRGQEVSDNIAVNLAIRLFAWILTGALVYMLLYKRGTGNERHQLCTTGLAVSAVNMVIWIGITIWYFSNIHGK